MAHMVSGTDGDIMPTILEIAGAKYPGTFRGQRIKPLEGQSLIPAVSGRGTMTGRPLFWEHMGNRAMRLGALKLVADNNAPWELYDLEADRTELNDVSSRFAGTVAELETRYVEWSQRVGVKNFNELKSVRRDRAE